LNKRKSGSPDKIGVKAMVQYDIKKIYEWPIGARALVLAFVSVMVLILGFIVDIWPYQSQFNNDKLQEVDLKNQLQLMINQQYVMKNDIAQLPTVKALLVNWQKNILTKNELPDILDEIIKIGQNNSLKIIAFNPATEVKDGIYYKTPVSIDMTGTYNQIANFISQLANMPKIINIDSFTLSNNQKNVASTDETQLTTSDVLLTGELDIEIYRK
jgi:type IV pilus assembly protein PilO